MNLNTQINIITISFTIGFLFSLTYNLIYKLLHNKHILIKIISHLLFIILFAYIYFKCLQKYCFGIFHIYSLLLLIFGFFIESSISKLIENKLKK